METKEINISHANFIESEVGLKTRTYTFPKAYAVAGGYKTENGRKIIKAGAPVPTNDASCVGLAFDDIDVTDGDVPASLMYGGSYYEDKLPVSIDSEAKSALAAMGLFAFEKPVDTFPAAGDISEAEE